MEKEIVSAIIAGIVALIVAFFTNKAASKRLKVDEKAISDRIKADEKIATDQIKMEEMAAFERLKAEERKLFTEIFTKSLYELRLKHYPTAFKITADLRSKSLFRKGGLSEGDFHSIRKDLEAWSFAEPQLLMSEAALMAYHELYSSLSRILKGSDIYDAQQLLEIQKANDHFRKCLRTDIGLLHKSIN